MGAQDEAVQVVLKGLRHGLRVEVREVCELVKLRVEYGLIFEAEIVSLVR